MPVNSAFLAAADGREIDMSHILRALQNEFQKERETAGWRGDGTVRYGLGKYLEEIPWSTITGEYRKDSQAVLREKNSRRERDGSLSVLRGTKKKERTGTGKKLEIGNSYGTFEIGFSKAAAKKNREDVQKAPEKLAVISGLRKDRGEKNSGITNMSVKMGLCRFRFCKSRAFVNPHVKERAQQHWKLDQEKTGKQADRESFFDEKSGKA
ncbi:MAG: hypothetical protein ACLU48_04270 [Clostridiaceae bacterium]